VTARAGEGPIKRRHTSGGLLDLLVSSRRGCVPLVFCGNLLRPCLIIEMLNHCSRGITVAA
jgi:hypothetical protein